MVFPKLDQYVPVSTTTNPVTQTADVAVKKEVNNPVGLPLAEDIGRDKKMVPITISMPNPITKIWDGVYRLIVFFI